MPGLRRWWSLALALLLAGCGSAPLSTPTPTPGNRPAAVAYRAPQPPDTVILPTAAGAAPTARADEIYLATATPPRSVGQATASTRSANGAPAPVPLGQPLRAWGWRVGCAGVEMPGATLAWSPVGQRLQAIGRWVVVALDATNEETAPRAFRGEDFIVRDAQDRIYRLVAALGAADYSVFRGGARPGESLPPGSAARYYLVFDVTADASGLRLIFHGSRPAIDGREFSLDLGR